jgi:hypothetical protein
MIMSRKGSVLVIVTVFLIATAAASLAVYNAVYLLGKMQGIEEVRRIKRYYAASSGLGYARMILEGPNTPTSFPARMSVNPALHSDLGLSGTEDVEIDISAPAGTVYPVTATYTLLGQNIVTVTENLDISRFMVEVAGTITDRASGLMWEQKTDTSGSINYFSYSYTWFDAYKVFLYGPVGLNTKAFAGFTDWRIPNVNELLTIADYGISGPVMSKITHYNLPYWASTSVNNETNRGYSYCVFNGAVYYISKHSKSLVRAVRGGQGGINRSTLPWEP